MRITGMRVFLIAVALIFTSAVASADFVEGGNAWVAFAPSGGTLVDGGGNIISQDWTMVHVLTFNSVIFSGGGSGAVPYPGGVRPSAGVEAGDGFPANPFGQFTPTDLGFQPQVNDQFILLGQIVHDGGQLAMLTGNNGQPGFDNAAEAVYNANFGNLEAQLGAAQVQTLNSLTILNTLLPGLTASQETLIETGSGIMASAGDFVDDAFGYSPGIPIGTLTMRVEDFGFLFPIGLMTYTATNGDFVNNQGVGNLPPLIPEPIGLLLCAVGAGIVLRRKRLAA